MTDWETAAKVADDMGLEWLALMDDRPKQKTAYLQKYGAAQDIARAFRERAAIQCDYPACMCAIKCDEIHDTVAYKGQPNTLNAAASIPAIAVTDEVVEKFGASFWGTQWQRGGIEKIRTALAAALSSPASTRIGSQQPDPGLSSSEEQSSCNASRGVETDSGRIAQECDGGKASASPALPVQEQEPVALTGFDEAASAAWDFVRPKLLEMNREKGPAGVWSTGYRSGWDAAMRAASPPEQELTAKVEAAVAHLETALLSADPYSHIRAARAALGDTP